MNMLRHTSFFFAFILVFQLSSFGQGNDESIKQLQDDVEELADKKYKGREAGTKYEEKAADYIADRFKDIGLLPLGDGGSYMQVFKFPKFKDPHSGIESDEMIEGRNVIGFIDNGAQNHVIIGAHYDHLGMGGKGSGSLSEEEDIHNGADDNASGVAVMLDVAKKLKQGKAKRNNYIIVAFTGEEKGLYGSNNFLKHPPNNFYLNTMNYMINLDMVGRLDPNKGVVINGVGTSPIWKIALSKADTMKLKFTTTESGVGPSDHTSFYLKDIPAIHFFTGSHTDYHKPSDDFDKINYEGMLSISDFIVSLITELNGKLKLAFTRTKDSDNHSTSAPKFKVTLGVIPDYLYDGEGMRIEGVREGKPAASAGIVGGDIVKSIGEVEVNDMKSYMIGLSKLESGQKAKVKVLRGDEELEFDVQF